MTDGKFHIGYFGDGPWAHQALEKILADASIAVDFICVRYETRDSVLCQMGESHGIPVKCVKNINAPDFLTEMQEIRPDLFVSMSFNQIFRDEMIHLPCYDTINCHAGKLPFYRGRNILNWALINDEKEFGVTVHYVDAGIDTGDIILQETYPITDADTYGTLLERSYGACSKLLYRAIRQIQAGMAQRIPQQMIDPIGMYCGARTEGDEIIDWRQSSRRVFNFIRALTRPGVGATTYLDGEIVKIYAAHEVPEARRYINTPGQILAKDVDGLTVKTEDTVIRITDYETAAHVRVGMRFQEK